MFSCTAEFNEITLNRPHVDEGNTVEHSCHIPLHCSEGNQSSNKAYIHVNIVKAKVIYYERVSLHPLHFYFNTSALINHLCKNYGAESIFIYIKLV